MSEAQQVTTVVVPSAPKARIDRPIRKGATFQDGKWHCRSCGVEVVPNLDGTHFQGRCDTPILTPIEFTGFYTPHGHFVATGVRQSGPEVRCRQTISSTISSTETVRKYRLNVLPDMVNHPAVPKYLRKYCRRNLRRGRKVSLIWRVLKDTIRHFTETANIAPPLSKAEQKAKTKSGAARHSLDRVRWT